MTRPRKVQTSGRGPGELDDLAGERLANGLRRRLPRPGCIAISTCSPSAVAGGGGLRFSEAGSRSSRYPIPLAYVFPSPFLRPPGSWMLQRNRGRRSWTEPSGQRRFRHGCPQSLVYSNHSGQLPGSIDCARIPQTSKACESGPRPAVQHAAEDRESGAGRSFLRNTRLVMTIKQYFRLFLLAALLGSVFAVLSPADHAGCRHRRTRWLIPAAATAGTAAQAMNRPPRAMPAWALAAASHVAHGVDPTGRGIRNCGPDSVRLTRNATVSNGPLHLIGTCAA